MILTLTDYCPRALRRCFHRFVSVLCTIVICGVVRVNAVASLPLVKVVDIIPESLSGETNTNCETNLAVNPANPSQIAATAYLPEPMGGNMSSILVSSNGGTTWTCIPVVPINKMSCDVTLRFGGLVNMLYLTALSDQWAFFICRSSNLGSVQMDIPVQQSKSGIDQPYVAAAAIGGQDRVFVGANNWYSSTAATATIVRSLNGTANSPNCTFTPVPIEFVAPAAGRDDPEIRTAISADGTKVYAVFNRVSSITANTRVGDVILVRDDDGGNSGAGSFEALNDSNGKPGLRVIQGRTFLFDALLGYDRMGGDLAIAVDPRNAEMVYIVWGEVLNNQPNPPPLLHVIRSTDGGKTWSGILHTVRNAKNPGLSINNNGTLAFLYQQVITVQGHDTWFTNVELTKDDFQNVTPLTLSKFPADDLRRIRGQPRIGDYLHLMAVGGTFYGIFSASNVPDMSRFPCQVTFQRHTSNNQLLDLNGRVVQPSVDPFFFKVTEQ